MRVVEAEAFLFERVFLKLLVRTGGGTKIDARTENNKTLDFLFFYLIAHIQRIALATMTKLR